MHNRITGGCTERIRPWCDSAARRGPRRRVLGRRMRARVYYRLASPAAGGSSAQCSAHHTCTWHGQGSSTHGLVWPHCGVNGKMTRYLIICNAQGQSLHICKTILQWELDSLCTLGCPNQQDHNFRCLCYTYIPTPSSYSHLDVTDVNIYVIV